jgi:hypothetical protein
MNSRGPQALCALIVIFIAACGGGGGGNSSNPPPPAANVNLSGLTLSAGNLTPAFSPQTLNYSATVPEGADTVTITPNAADAGSTISVNGTAVTTGTASAPIALPVGPSMITIVVSNGTSSRTTTITVTRRDATAATATIVFPPEGLTDAGTITVTGTAADAETNVVSVTVNGIAATSSDGFATWRAMSVPLSLGETTLTIAVENAGLAMDAAAASVAITREPLLLDPRDISLDTNNNRALIADFTNAAVIGVDLVSGDLSEISGASIGAGTALDRPRVITVDPSRARALVGDEGLTAVVAIDVTNGDRTTVSDTVTGPDWFWFYGMDLDAVNDRVLVAALTGRRSVFSLDLATGDDTLLTEQIGGGSDPSDLVQDVANGRVLLADPFFRSIDAVDLDGVTPETQISGSVRGAGPDFGAPTGLLLDSANSRVVVADSLLSGLLSVDVATGDRAILSDAANGTGPELVSPVGIVADDGNNRLLVIDSGRDAVVAVDPATGNRSILGQTSVGNGFSFKAPLFFDIDETNGRLIVVDSARDAIVGADLQSRDRTLIAEPPGFGPFNQPIAVDSPGDRAFFFGGRDLSSVWIVDLATGSLSGIPITPGAGPEFFLEGMTYDTVNDRILATDSFGGTGAVLLIDPVTGNRSYISRAATFGPNEPEVGSGPPIAGPQGIVLDFFNTRVLIADDWGSSIIAADLVSGDRTIISDDTTGTGPEFQRIDGIGLDSANNRVLVTEFFPPSVIAVDLATGNRTYLSDNTGAGSGPRLVKPGDVKVDPDSGVIYVGDEGLSAIIAIDPQSGDRVIVTK